MRIGYEGRIVKTIPGAEAAQILERLRGASPASEQQLLARATGNFKRGNERR